MRTKILHSSCSSYARQIGRKKPPDKATNFYRRIHLLKQSKKSNSSTMNENVNDLDDDLTSNISSINNFDVDAPNVDDLEDEFSVDVLLCNSDENINFLDLPINAHSLLLVDTFGMYPILYDPQVDPICCPCWVLGRRCKDSNCVFVHDALTATNTRSDFLGLLHYNASLLNDFTLPSFQHAFDRLEHVCASFKVFEKTEIGLIPGSHQFSDTNCCTLNVNDLSSFSSTLSVDDSVHNVVKISANEVYSLDTSDTYCYNACLSSLCGFCYDPALCCIYDCRPWTINLIAYYCSCSCTTAMCFWIYFAKYKYLLALCHMCNLLIDYYIRILYMCNSLVDYYISVLCMCMSIEMCILVKTLSDVLYKYSSYLFSVCFASL